MKKIDQYKQIFTIIFQEVSIDIKDMKEFKELEKLSRSLQDKKDDLKQAIENYVAQVIERDLYLAAEKPRAR